MDIIPISIAIAQAAKKVAGGHQDLLLEGNAMFGQWTWTGSDGIEPSDKGENTEAIRS